MAMSKPDSCPQRRPKTRLKSERKNEAEGRCSDTGAHLSYPTNARRIRMLREESDKGLMRQPVAEEEKKNQTLTVSVQILYSI